VTFVVEELSFSAGSRQLFSGLGFALRSGESIAIRGPSGSGKSALLRQLAFLVPLRTGTVTLEGRTALQWGVPEWRARVTYVAQRPVTLHATPRQYAAAAARLKARAARPLDNPARLTERWGLHAEAWDQPWSSLSGGEQQRIHVAVALAHRPEVLLLDEPTSAVDPAACEQMETDLRGLSRVWVTHDRAQAERVADRAIEIGA
jgi:putative ABC transport system ATP-binding protein